MKQTDTPLNKEQFLAAGQRVVLREAEALRRLSECLDGGFSEAAALLAENRGRVIVSGIGKSGHIARKIAATLASTGKPAHFVHPAEASHGDLGMMAVNDVAMILSNSGETSELADIIAYTRRFRIPMIGVAGRRSSTLIRQADVGIILPDVGEACDRGIVPTTSTTMMLALGDALAIALMEHKGFTPASFREFHPGGALGSSLSIVRDLMHSGEKLPLVRESAMMPDALLIMTNKGFGVAGVCDADGRLTGIITDGDLRRHMDGLLTNSVHDVMTPDPQTITPDALAVEAVGLMNARKITCLFVVEPELNVCGILHIHDCLRAGAG
ncbi:MAG: KpsF/GutQ family sugar-phosphate isomerase [Rhodobacteraceae bacterium]|nr:KpsF/GutQ family sugar-phosphate isomerase [Paracoccaceae bacterium]